MENKGNTNSTGIGLFGMTFIVLLILKLAKVCEISWLIVFSPLIIGFSLAIVIIVFVSLWQ